MKRCSVCGFSFDDIIKNKSIGCPSCYKTFRSEFLFSLKQNNIKIGVENEEELKEEECGKSLNKEVLLRQMEKAVGEENYERAAIYRDCLRALDNGTKN